MTGPMDGERETALSCCQEQGAQGTKRLLRAVGGPGPVKDVSVSGIESAGRVGVRLADYVSARQGPGHGCTVQCLTSFSWNEVGSKYTFEKPLYGTKSNPIPEESTIGGRSLINTF